MNKTLLTGLLVLAATSFAASNTYKVEIRQDSVVEGKTLKAGDYKVSFENGNAIFKHGKDVVQLAAREESQQYKTETNELTYKDGKTLEAIRIGGTTTRIVFDGAGSAQSGM